MSGDNKRQPGPILGQIPHLPRPARLPAADEITPDRMRQHLKDILTIQRVCGTGNPDTIEWALNQIDALRASLTTLVVAAGRMREGWAEGDDAYRKRLWQALHQAADDADERHGIYPL